MAAARGDRRRLLVITADDYGYWPSYNQGILEAIEMGAIDCVSAMVEREFCEAEPLLETGVEIGLHVEFEGRWGSRSGAPARTSLRVQLERYLDLFGRWPSFLNGHKHCHARPELATPVFQLAQQMSVPVRSVSPDHRQWLRERGIDTPDALIGRTRSNEPPEPAELRSLAPGVTEWVIHPGHPDPSSGSSYDIARHEDLALLQKVMVRARFDEPIWGDARRVSMKEAFAQERGDVEQSATDA
ncbi:MAG: ChbG/HpnK family deacetylase [Solirubrobacterales bacterium]|nr:ChbG/HpnK family deacetylase [Solirubrobacterales bacterium]